MNQSRAKSIDTKRVTEAVLLGLSISLAMFLFIALSTSQAFAETTPQETVLGAVDDIKKEIKENKSKLSTKELDGKLFAILDPVFDFQEMARRSLGLHWRNIDDGQKKEFVALFSDLLARNYLKQIRENISESDLSVVGERVKGKKAMVKTKVSQDGRDVAIDYRLRNKKNSWQVYDVVVENIGLVSNYRSEFSGIIRKEQFEGLIKRLKEK